MYLKYLVTGATGPVGRLVTDLLVENGNSVKVLVPEGTDTSEFENKGVEVSEGLITDKDSMKDFFNVEDPRHSCLIHTEEICSISEKVNMEMRRVNFTGTQNIVDTCLKTKIGRLVYLGSAYALNPGASLENSVIHFDRRAVEGEYAKTKAEAGEYIIEKMSLNKLNAVMLLPTFIIGPGFKEDSPIGQILKGYLEKGIATVDGGHAFVDVRDVAMALLAISENGQVGASYVLNGEYKSTEEFFQSVKEISGSTVDVKKMPKWMMGKNMGKFVDTYYRVTKKDNPKEVYALFRNNPNANFSSNVEEMIPDLQITSVYDSLSATLNDQ
ncbi:dihydroflavonol-4-reductase [Oscillospiraceae bacterium]|nr:dihydroflavonol-4-reductase [Oscillospiraceae bacterium]